MVGRDKSKSHWRVLKIDRLEPSELYFQEDPTTYMKVECNELLKRIHEGNKSTGGLKFVTSCYGIVGFVKFLGPYYMLLITARKEIGSICGHMVYAVTKSEMVALQNPRTCSNTAVSNSENRYKRLLCTVDLTKDFFFSYSYHVMRSLQKNLCDNQAEHVLYETMFVWNEFLTRGIRNHLNNSLWTVALVYGFFKQAKLSIAGKEFNLALIARRSRHYAGTRYLKRGVNEYGRVANDVETEQIVFEYNPEGIATQISSVVQNRGSIPLFWSQETSRLNLKPDIVLHQKDNNYEATRLHFENLAKRYGNPIIILNLIKTQEKKPRESILRTEFANAIDIINKDLLEENRLKFLHWDLNKHARSKGTNVLATLGKVGAYALNLTGFFYCHITPIVREEGALNWPVLSDNDTSKLMDNNDNDQNTENGSLGDSIASSDGSQSGKENNEIKPPKFQKGVLRTNCIDCLDRTNVAQYAYGLASLGHQLHVLSLSNIPKIDIDSSLAKDLMRFYETMGDTLALQYGGSAAHNKIFSERRGQWKAAIQSQEFFRTLQRYYSNAYMDAEKQDAINLFLGNFQPEEDKPALWELDSYNYDGRHSNGFPVEDARSFMKRSLSDGNILRQSDDGTPEPIGHRPTNSAVSGAQIGDAQDYSNSAPEISSSESGISYSRCTRIVPGRHVYAESAHNCFSEHGLGESTSSNFLDLDWLSTCDDSCEGEIFSRSMFTNSTADNLSSENIINDLSADIKELNGMGKRNSSKLSSNAAAQSSSNLGEYSDSFVNWVISGETHCY